MDSKLLSSIARLACETVWHDLNNEFFRQSGATTDHTLADDISNTYWSNGGFYVNGEVVRVSINKQWYLFDHLYICESGKIIVVAKKFVGEDFWDNKEVEEIQVELYPTYFVMEY
jgi:hypothetical protein